MLKVRLAHNNGTAPSGGIVFLILIGHHYGGTTGQGTIIHTGRLAGVKVNSLQHGCAAEYVNAYASKRRGQGNLVEL